MVMTRHAEPILRLERVRRTFGTVTAVEGLDLEVAQGELFGLLGPNGAGKTTSIRMICGELPCDSGRILLRGQALRSDPTHRHLVGWCPQEIVIWKQLTCLEQLEFIGQLYGMSRMAAHRRGMDLLTELGLAEQRTTLGAHLSGGMQRRLNIALALVHDPPLVILDEPGAGLDPASRVLVRAVIRSLAQDRAVLLTTHEMDEAERLCDRIAIMDHGVLLAQGDRRRAAPTGRWRPAHRTTIRHLRTRRCPSGPDASRTGGRTADHDERFPPALPRRRTHHRLR